jgi:hypothetical protein
MPNRYWRRGLSKVMFATAIANTASVTRSEITAAVNLTPQVTDVNRSYSTSDIDTPDWLTTFTPTIPGEQKASFSLKLYDLDGTTDTIRDALPEGTTGFMLLFPKGDVVGKRMEVWPVRVNGAPMDDYSAGNEAARYDVAFSCTAAPKVNDVIPA